MRAASNLLALGGAAILVMVLATGTASATQTIEVSNETEGGVCNPCNILVEGESSILVEDTMQPVTSCEDTFEASIDADGTGEIVSLVNANHSGQNCLTEICDGEGGEPGSEAHWPFRIEQDNESSFHFEVRFCLDARLAPGESSAGVHCNLRAEVSPEVSIEHHYEVVASHHCSGLNRILNGRWETQHGLTHPGDAPHEAIEIDLAPTEE
jgi:hypothetical protein